MHKTEVEWDAIHYHKPIPSAQDDPSMIRNEISKVHAKRINPAP